MCFQGKCSVWVSLKGFAFLTRNSGQLQMPELDLGMDYIFSRRYIAV
jgi:hypothetical protein